MDKTAVLDLSEALNRADGDQDFFVTLATLFYRKVRRMLPQLARRWSGKIVRGWRLLRIS